MKLSYLPLPLLAAVALTACSNDMPDFNEKDGNVVTFTAKLPTDMGTRDFGDGTQAKVLKYAVYDAEENLIFSCESENAPQAQSIADGFTLSLPLPVNRTYSFVF